jgi:hypothetical protein
VALVDRISEAVAVGQAGCHHGDVRPLGAAGTISTPVTATYNFDEVRKAIMKATQGGGKVLLTPKM